MRGLLTVCFTGLLCVKVALGTYNQTLAIQFAKFAAAAYCSKESLESWSCPLCVEGVTSVKTCQATTKDHTQAFVGRWNGRCMISFEGTEDPFSMLTDLEIYLKEPVFWYACENCSVHEGFLGVWNNLKPCLIQNLNDIGCSLTNGSEVHITGHSLGAGVGAIAMMGMRADGWTVADSYNFGMPRTGNIEFARNFSQSFLGRFWRVTHHRDPIVQLPPDVWDIGVPIHWDYEHVEPEIFYDGAVNKGYVECRRVDDMNCSLQYWDFNWQVSDHMVYVGVPMGIAGCGYSHQFFV